MKVIRFEVLHAITFAFSVLLTFSKSHAHIESGDVLSTIKGIPSLLVPSSDKSYTPFQICQDLVLPYAYPCVEYTTLTSDGWELKIQRINLREAGSAAGVVFFQHGLLDSAAGILLPGPKESLAFGLADTGYDVWLGNNRGNKVSMTNLHFSETEPGFWNFTMDDMAAIDLPTQLLFVLNQTGAKQLTYIGHSQGTVQAFMGFQNASVAALVNGYIALAPITHIGNVESELVRLGAELYTDDLLKELGVLRIEFSDDLQDFMAGKCADSLEICMDIMMALNGPSVDENSTQIPLDVHYFPAATSVKNYAQWMQWIRTGVYAKYDYGSHQANMEHYGSPKPPLYNELLIPETLPLYFFHGTHDYLSDSIDFANLVALLSQNRSSPSVMTVEGYNHIDYIEATNAYQIEYPKIYAILNNIWNTS